MLSAMRANIAAARKCFEGCARHLSKACESKRRRAALGNLGNVYGIAREIGQYDIKPSRIAGQYDPSRIAIAIAEKSATSALRASISAISATSTSVQGQFDEAISHLHPGPRHRPRNRQQAL